MLKIFEVLFKVESNRQRGSGRTTALAQAADDTRGVLLVATYSQVKLLQPLFPNATIVVPHHIDQIETNKPIFIDHYLYYILVKNFDKEKREKIFELENQIKEFKVLVSDMENQIKELQKNRDQKRNYNDKKNNQSFFSKLFGNKN